MYKRLLVVVDKRPVSRAAVAEGIALAKDQGAELFFFYALPLYPMPLADVPPFVVVPPATFQDAANEEAEALLARVHALASKAGVSSRSIKGRGDDPAHNIVDAARRRRCDLIIVASAGRNAVLRLLTGSVIPALITASPIPVLICKAAAKASAVSRKSVGPSTAGKATGPVASRKSARSR